MNTSFEIFFSQVPPTKGTGRESVLPLLLGGISAKCPGQKDRFCFSGVLLLFVLVSLWGCSEPEIPRGDIRNSVGDLSGNNYFPAMGNFPTKASALKLEVTDGFSSGFVGNPLVLSREAIAAVTSDGSIALFVDEKMRWKVSLPEGIPVSDICGGSDNTLYVIDSKSNLCAMSIEGELLWQVSLGEGDLAHAMLALAPDRIYALAGKSLHIVLFDGKIYRTTTFAMPTMPYLSVNSDGTTAIVCRDGNSGGDSLIMLSKRGERLWGRFLHRTYLTCPPALGSTSISATGIVQSDDEKEGVLHTLDNVGNIVWSMVLPCLPEGQAVAADGVRFVNGIAAADTTKSMLLKIYPTGKIAKKLDLDVFPTSPPFINDIELSMTTLSPSGEIGWWTAALDTEDIASSQIPLEGLPFPTSRPVVSASAECVVITSRVSSAVTLIK